MTDLSHTDDQGRAAMVDVGQKPLVRRRARAAGRISLNAETVELIRRNAMKKGDVLAVARIAAIGAAKQAAALIPLCHPLRLDGIDVSLKVADAGVEAAVEVRAVERTGVEMEALTAVSVALLTVYDMCKAVDKSMTIADIRLLEKTKEPVDGR